MFSKGDNFSRFPGCLSGVRSLPKMGSTLKGKNLLPAEQILFFKSRPLMMEGKNENDRVISHEIVPIHHQKDYLVDWELGLMAMAVFKKYKKQAYSAKGKEYFRTDNPYAEVFISLLFGAFVKGKYLIRILSFDQFSSDAISTISINSF